ncbi:alpha/beta hydrolase [Desulfonatronovibrio magnus]|uniref:alpha/beta hydrolase n=1 Tax=Desulfonatronovibrio magnus TaxID=698827 RepID=UPI000B20FCD7|nr:alpha/beta hydrolase [Desulfonatronovibrio magnus]
MKIIVSFISVLLFLYLVILGYMYLFQHRMIYIPFSQIESDPEQIGLSYQEVYLDSQGKEIHGWFIPAENERGVILFCHGNAGNISHRLQTISIFNSLNMSTFIFDYQGYGKSSGRPGEKATYQDALAAWTYLTETRNIQENRIFIFGRSLGGAVAAELGARKSPAGIVLESTFTSVPDLGSELFRFLPVRLLSRFKYNTLEKVESFSAPVKIIHSQDDEIIPFHHGRTLYKASPEPRYFTEISGGHNTGFMESIEEYTMALDEFFERYQPSAE